MPLSTVKPQGLLAGDIYAIAWVMSDGILANYLQMYQVASSKFPEIRTYEDFFNKLLYPQYKRQFGKAKPDYDDKLPTDLWMKISWDKETSIQKPHTSTKTKSDEKPDFDNILF